MLYNLVLIENQQAERILLAYFEGRRIYFSSNTARVLIAEYGASISCNVYIDKDALAIVFKFFGDNDDESGRHKITMTQQKNQKKLMISIQRVLTKLGLSKGDVTGPLTILECETPKLGKVYAINLITK